MKRLYPHPAGILFGICFIIFTSITTIAQDASTIEALKKLSVEELMNIEVTSVSRRAEKLTGAASAIQVITREDIRRIGATSIPEALRLATNLHVAQKNSHDWAISARGFNTELANKLLVMIDGRTVYTPLFSGVFWDRQDYLLEDIERIEIISGPGGNLWGANAVNGVINIITRKTSDTKGVYGEIGVGTQLRNFAGARYGGNLGANTSFRVYGKYFDRDDAVFENGEDASDAWQMGQSGFRIDSDGTGKSSFTLQGDYYNSRVRLSTGGTAKVNGGNILGKWNYTISDNSNLSLQVYYDRTSLNQPVPETKSEDNATVFAPAGTLKDVLDTYDLDFQHSVTPWSRVKIVWGLGYRFTHNEINNAPALAFIPEQLDRNLFSSFVQGEGLLAENLFLTLGSKIEHNDYTGFEFEPHGNLKWNISANHMLWGAVSRAVRMPSRIDRHVRLPTPNLSFIGIDNILIGGDSFDSETVIAFELGYRTQLASRLSGAISAFYNIYDKVRSTSQSPPDGFGFTFPFFYENNLEGETYGTELTATYQITDWWRLRGGYTWLYTDIRIARGKTDFNNALNETADPKNHLSLFSFINLSDNFSFDAGLRFVDNFTFNRSGTPDRVSEYTELDARFSWLPSSKFEISVTGQNLLKDQHVEYVISNPNPRAEIERSVYIKIACRL